MELRELQATMRDTYGERDAARGVDATFRWFTEEVGELAKAIRTGDRAELELGVLRRAGLARLARRAAGDRPRRRDGPLRRRVPQVRRSPVRVRPVNDVRVRMAAPSDWPAVAGLLVELGRGVAAGTAADPTHQLQFAGHIRRIEHVTLVAEDDERRDRRDRHGVPPAPRRSPSAGARARPDRHRACARHRRRPRAAVSRRRARAAPGLLPDGAGHGELARATRSRSTSARDGRATARGS